tara:strand:+ start:2545 stop:2709 length:165 start_codon:yes stop_codon:yes gene_type:complete
MEQIERDWDKEIAIMKVELERMQGVIDNLRVIINNRAEVNNKYKQEKKWMSTKN